VAPGEGWTSIRFSSTKPVGACFLRDSLMCEQLMEAEVSELVEADRGERAPEERLMHRNRYRPPAWHTRAGEIDFEST
jgi:transposase-like protein